MKKLGLILVVLFFHLPLHAQVTKLQPDGINGSLGAGFSVFKVLSPNNLGIRFDDGVYLAVNGEKGFGALHLYLTFSLNYLKTTGEAYYKYQSLSTFYQSATPVAFTTELMQLGLGLRLKIIQDYWFRPYVEGGALGGYFSIKYTDLDNELGNPSPKDYKSTDSLLDFGSYYEGGLEISFSDTFGMRVAARFTNNETKELKTFNNQKLNYTTEVYYLSALKAF